MIRRPDRRFRFRPAHLMIPALVLALAAGSAASQSTQPAPAVPSAIPFSADAYLAHVKYLASDELGGRATGSPGIDQAADYIVRQFQAAGCEPGGPDGSFFQNFEVRYGKKLVEADAKLAVDGLAPTWTVRQDWIPFPFSEMCPV